MSKSGFCEIFAQKLLLETFNSSILNAPKDRFEKDNHPLFYCESLGSSFVQTFNWSIL